MKAILNKLINQEHMSSEEAKDVLVKISKGKYNQAQITSFLTIYMMRSITIDELRGFRDALLELCIPVDLSEYNTIDLCGTGGDAKDTFNISTLSSFVTAGAGVQVAKHGNYGVSSASGSSNVMEALGITFSDKPSELKKALEETNICFLHAPLFHPALKKVAPVRKDLGLKTFFNMLGPMVNPSFPKHQLVGVFNLELQRIYNYLYQDTEINYSIVHALDGYDEISLTGHSKIISNQSESILSPKDLNIPTIEPKDIYGGKSVKTSAKTFLKIINGDGSDAQNNVVCANAGLAIAMVKNLSHTEGFELAKDSLFGLKAKASLNKLIALSE
ncbi:anthranilate phosphoribosyltransferase [Bizionia paragorgiae]|uniref:Anthranilate phosphoribosyltransferase n=1 Tax=Bizionia paragorgiae TaxID=283786 RepID=A0A1H3ZBH7_BIZPA|nr:anthranilate phosphoribosyltransferase [Bizionia paragorgiae]SEA20965.1 anthranilate phosphoribosyltransferase [Bizionia paragorgiae]